MFWLCSITTDSQYSLPGTRSSLSAAEAAPPSPPPLPVKRSRSRILPLSNNNYSPKISYKHSWGVAVCLCGVNSSS